MGYYNNHKLDLLVNDLLVAIKNHTPESIAAAGGEARKQMVLTDEQEQKLKAASDLIERAAQAKTDTDLEIKKLAEDKSKHELDVEENRVRGLELSAEAKRLSSLEQSIARREAQVVQDETTLTALNSKLKDKETFLDGREAGLNAREEAIKAKEIKFRLALAGE